MDYFPNHSHAGFIYSECCIIQHKTLYMNNKPVTWYCSHLPKALPTCTQFWLFAPVPHWGNGAGLHNDTIVLFTVYIEATFLAVHVYQSTGVQVTYMHSIYYNILKKSISRTDVLILITIMEDKGYLANY